MLVQLGVSEFQAWAVQGSLDELYPVSLWARVESESESEVSTLSLFYGARQAAECGACATSCFWGSSVLAAGQQAPDPVLDQVTDLTAKAELVMSTFQELIWAGKAFRAEKLIMSCRLWHLFIWQKEPKAKIALLPGPGPGAVSR